MDKRQSKLAAAVPAHLSFLRSTTAANGGNAKSTKQQKDKEAGFHNLKYKDNGADSKLLSPGCLLTIYPKEKHVQQHQQQQRHQATEQDTLQRSEYFGKAKGLRKE